MMLPRLPVTVALVYPFALHFAQAAENTTSSYPEHTITLMVEATLQKITHGLRQAIEDADIRQQISSQGAEIILDSPQEFQTFLLREYEKWNHVAQKSEIAAQ